MSFSLLHYYYYYYYFVLFRFVLFRFVLFRFVWGRGGGFSAGFGADAHRRRDTIDFEWTIWRLLSLRIGGSLEGDSASRFGPCDVTSRDVTWPGFSIRVHVQPICCLFLSGFLLQIALAVTVVAVTRWNERGGERGWGTKLKTMLAEWNGFNVTRVNILTLVIDTKTVWCDRADFQHYLWKLMSLLTNNYVFDPQISKMVCIRPIELLAGIWTVGPGDLKRVACIHIDHWWKIVLCL